MKEKFRLSFADYMKRRGLSYNVALWNTDPQYKAKVWKARRQLYLRICEKKNLLNEFDQINNEVIDYEIKVLNIKYKNKGLTDTQYQEEFERITHKYR